MNQAAQTDLLTLEVLRLREFRDKVMQWMADGFQGGNGESFGSNLDDLYQSLGYPPLPVPNWSGCCRVGVNENGFCTGCGEHV